MNKKENVWLKRWEELKKSGASREVALQVHAMLDRQRAFHYQFISGSARRDLDRVWPKEVTRE